MINRNNKTVRSIEISLGLIVGYFVGAAIGKFIFGMEWDKALLNQKLIFGLLAIGLTLIIYFWRQQKNNPPAE
jgi:hypothetical protein